MKSTNITSPCVAVLAAIILLPGYAHGIALTNALYDGIDYTMTDNPGDNTSDGDIQANNGGTGWGDTPSFWTTSNAGGTSTNATLNVVAPGLSYPGLLSTAKALNLNAASASQQYFRLFNQGDVINSGTFYFSFLVRKGADSQRTINMAFLNGTSERFAVGQFSPTTTATNGNFGVTQLNNTTVGGVPANPITFDLGLTYLIVGRVDFDTAGANDRLTLYVNPAVDGSGEPASPYLQLETADFVAINQIRPFVGNASTSPVHPASNAAFDEIRAGPTYSAVTVPEPGSASLLALAGLGLLGRRRRRA